MFAHLSVPKVLFFIIIIIIIIIIYSMKGITSRTLIKNIKFFDLPDRLVVTMPLIVY